MDRFFRDADARHDSASKLGDLADMSDQATSCLHTSCMGNVSYHVGARCKVRYAAWYQCEVFLHLLNLGGL